MTRFTTAMALITLAAGTAQAACPDQTRSYLINGGLELPNGVPNYDQGNFSPGSGDCGPTAIAQVLGYWDANGWSTLYKDTSPYVGNANFVLAAHPSIDNAVEYFKHNLDYTYPRGGTTHVPVIYNWGPALKDFVNEQVSTASWTTSDGYPSFSGIKSEVSADRPVVLNVLGVPGTRLTWNSPSGSPEWTIPISHSMAALGYREVVKFADTWFGCVDWLAGDDRYVVLRSGWRSGGDSTVYYHWSTWDRRTALDVRPGGETSAVDDRKAKVFNGSQVSTWDVERDTKSGATTTISSYISGLPSSPDAAVTMANGKAYVFKGSQYWRVDLDSQTIDSGYPGQISSGWSGIPNDLDAAVWTSRQDGTIYFFKGSSYYTWNVASDSLASGARSIGSGFNGLPNDVDGAMNFDNGRLYVFKGSTYYRFDLRRNRGDSGYPLSTSGYWPGLSSVDAVISPQRQLLRDGSVASGVERTYTFDVGGSPRNVSIELTGNGDADLYVRRSSRPTTSQYDCRPYYSSSNETCTLNNITGRVYVTVRGYAAQSDFELDANWAW